MCATHEVLNHKGEVTGCDGWDREGLKGQSMWQIPARRSAVRVGEANGSNQPHSVCRETKVDEAQNRRPCRKSERVLPLVVVVVVGYSCADPVLTELEFQVGPTNIRHTHIPPPSPFSSASFATAATL